MVKDKIFASTLYQIAKVFKIETSYDNKYNRPINIEKFQEFPCRIVRKNTAYPIIDASSIGVNPNFRGYFEIDADIISGSVINVDNVKYIVGLVYRPMNHHIECDLSISTEA